MRWLSHSRPDRAGRVEPLQRVGQPRLEPLLRRLLADRAQDRPAMVRYRLQIQHLPALRRQHLQQLRLPGPGRPGQHTEPEPTRHLFQHLADVCPVRHVPAGEDGHPPADLGHHMRERRRPHPAPPTINERPEPLRFFRQRACQVPGDVRGHQPGPESAGGERAGLMVQGADRGAFVVRQHRQVDRPRDVVLGELARRADVDDRVERAGAGPELVGRLRQVLHVGFSLPDAGGAAGGLVDLLAAERFNEGRRCDAFCAFSRGRSAGWPSPTTR